VPNTNASLLLRDARVIGSEFVIEHGSVLIEDGRIARLSDASQTFEADPNSTLNLTGSVLMPGLIDVHIHGAAGVDTMVGAPEDFLQLAAFLASKGVTGWLPTLVPASQQEYERTIAAIDQAIKLQVGNLLDQSASARILGAHYEGPFVNSAQCGALHVSHFRRYTDKDQLDQLPLLRVRGAKMMMTFAPEVEGGVELARSLFSKGWISSIGHTRADVRVLDRDLAAGAKHMTHFMNAMAPLHHRSPGPIAWGLMSDDVSFDMIADGHHLDPYTLRMLTKLKGSRRVCLISDAISAAGKGDGDYEVWGETIKVSGGKTSNARGSIAGSVITMLDAVRMMKSLGVPDVEVASMASFNPAKLLGLDHEIGSIEEGKRADLVAMDPDGNVKLSIVGGQVAFKN